MTDLDLNFNFWSLPEQSEEPQMLAQFIYDREQNWFYEKKIQNFFKIFFSFFDTLHTQKDFFALLGQK